MRGRDGVTELYELTPVEILSNITYCTVIIHQLRTYYLQSVMHQPCPLFLHNM